MRIPLLPKCCRYSLSGGIKPIPPPLISVDTSHSVSSSDAGGHANGGVDFGGAVANGGGGGGIFGSSMFSHNHHNDDGLPAVYGLPASASASAVAAPASFHHHTLAHPASHHRHSRPSSR